MVKLLDVKYQKQKQLYWCMPTCLSMVLDYYGYDVSQRKIAHTIPDRCIRGMANQDFVNVAKQFPKMTAKYHKKSKLEDIVNYLDQNIPVTSIIGLGEIKTNKIEFYQHAILVVGYNKDNFYVNDPWYGQYKINFDEFLYMWSKRREKSRFPDYEILPVMPKLK